MLQLNRILVASDKGPQAEGVYASAFELARRFGSEIHVLHVSPATEAGFRSRKAPPEVAAQREAGVDPDGERALAVIEVEVESSSVPWAIIGYAEEQEIDLIVLGGSGNQGLGLRRLGGVAGPVVRYSRCAVLTVRGPFPEHGSRRILVPVDLSPACRVHLAVAKELATVFGATVDLFTAIEQLPYPTTFGMGVAIGLEQEVFRRWEPRLRALFEEIPGPPIPYEVHLRAGPAGQEIIDFALKTAPDLIVIGTHGRTGLRRLVLGSVAEAVVYRALAATLTVKTFGRPLLREAPPASIADVALT